MGEVCPQANAQAVDLYGSAEVQCHTGVGIPVDAPGGERPGAVAVVAVNAVDGVLCFEHSLAPGLHIGVGVGIATLDLMLIAHIQRQVTVVFHFKVRRCAGVDKVANAGKCPLGVDGGPLAEGNGVNQIFGQIAQAVPEDIVYLAMDMGGVLRGLNDDLIARLVFF